MYSYESLDYDIPTVSSAEKTRFSQTKRASLAAERVVQAGSPCH